MKTWKKVSGDALHGLSMATVGIVVSAIAFLIAGSLFVVVVNMLQRFNGWVSAF